MVRDVIGAMLRVGTAGCVGMAGLSTNPNEVRWLSSTTASGMGISDLGAPVGLIDVSGLDLGLDLLRSPVGVLSMDLGGSLGGSSSPVLVMPVGAGAAVVVGAERDALESWEFDCSEVWVFFALGALLVTGSFGTRDDDELDEEADFFWRAAAFLMALAVALDRTSAIAA